MWLCEFTGKDQKQVIRGVGLFVLCKGNVRLGGGGSFLKLGLGCLILKSRGGGHVTLERRASVLSVERLAMGRQGWRSELCQNVVTCREFTLRRPQDKSKHVWEERRNVGSLLLQRGRRWLHMTSK